MADVRKGTHHHSYRIHRVTVTMPRKGFRLYWWRRSRRLGRPRMSREIRDLIRKMSQANPLWGAPRIHGELLKLGIDVSQATVGRYLAWRPQAPSPTWRLFLHNHLHDTAAVDMFVVVTARYRLLPGRARPRAKESHPFRCHSKPNTRLADAPNHRGLPLGHRAWLSAARPRRDIWSVLPRSSSGDGDRGGRHRT